MTMQIVPGTWSYTGAYWCIIVQSSYQETFAVLGGGRMKHSCGNDLV